MINGKTKIVILIVEKNDIVIYILVIFRHLVIVKIK